MATRDFLLPDVGEGLTEAEVVRWHVGVGDHVGVNDPLVEIETAKALVELPSPHAGRVAELLVAPGMPVPVGTPIVRFELAGTDDDPEPGSDREAGSGALLVGYGTTGSSAPARRRRGADSPVPTTTATPAASTRVGVLAKPPVRHLAMRLGVDLSHVAGSGPGGIVTRDDVQRSLHAAPGNGHGPVRPVRDRPGDVRSAPSAVQRAMAGAMERSASTIPQATVWLEVDVTDAFAELDRLRSDPEFADVRLTPMLLVAEALLSAVEAHPISAAVWDGATSELVHRGAVNLGVAVASPRGLIVPTIKDAPSLSRGQLAQALADLTMAAREGRTTPADMSEGTLTITNVGVFGIDGGMPLVNPGESVILAVGRAVPRPWVVGGDLCVRTVLQLTLSFDHRVLDGAAACAFLAAVGEHLGHS